MARVIGDYSCQKCQGKLFRLLEQRRKGSWGNITVPILRCENCKGTFEIGATSTRGLVMNKKDNKTRNNEGEHL